MFIVLILITLGLVFGSFAGAQVWRLRARQLVEDKVAGEEYDKREYKRLTELTKHKGSSDRSRCLECKHELRWYDLIPLISWVSTSGKCRYCKKPIGYFEPLIELGTALLFVVSYSFWPGGLVSPVEVVQFVLWLVILVMMVILFAYDAKWFLLPDRIVIPAIALAVLYVLIEAFQVTDILSYSINLLASVLILSGIYFVLWVISRGRWIGFGDIKLGIILALLLANWQLALLTLFLANLIGCLIVIPGLLSKKMSRQTQVPFGPMLILGFFISFFWGGQLIDWYLSTTMMLML